MSRFPLQKVNGWDFKPSRPWVEETVKNAGIDTPVEWREHVDLNENIAARRWLVWKMNLGNVSQIKEEYWTKKRMIEYVQFNFLRRPDD